MDKTSADGWMTTPLTSDVEKYYIYPATEKPACGIEPVEFNVLIKPDDVQAQTKGGIHLPDEFKDREKHRQTKGTIVAVSAMAFNEDIWPVDQEKPKPGDRVAIALHAGAFITGEDGVEYRMIKDKDVTALIG